METTYKPIPLILKEEFLRRKSKNSGYSLRAFSKALGLSSSFLSKLLNGQKNISEDRMRLIAKRLNLEDDAMEHLSYHLKDDTESSNFMDVDMDAFEFISDWYHYAILETVSLANYDGTAEFIAKALDLSIDKTENAVQRLARLNLLAIDSKGKIKTKNKNLTTKNHPVPSSAHTEHERQLLQKALEALDHISPQDRSQSSMTMAIPSSRLPEARQKILAFQREMNTLLQRKGPRDSVFQLSVSFFPLTQLETKTKLKGEKK